MDSVVTIVEVAGAVMALEFNTATVTAANLIEYLIAEQQLTHVLPAGYSLSYRLHREGVQLPPEQALSEGRGVSGDRLHVVALRRPLSAAGRMP